jgi:LmbE family N-acetylglucosaminyl deacetylase
MTKTSKLVLLGEVAPDYVAHLLGSIPPERRAHLNFHPLVHPNHLPTFLASHDLGLALEDGLPPSRNLTITNKILQYLNAGLAVVCTDTAGQREVLQKGPEAGCIMDFSDASLAAAKLDHLIANASELGTAQRAARSLAEQHYCWERQSGALLLLVERAISLEQPKRAIIPPRSSDKHSLQNANTYSSDTPTLTSSRAQVISRLKYPARVFLHYLACLTAHLRARPLDLKSLGHTLIVAPHPDDESLGCGALIAKLASLNARVSVLFLTDSNGPNVAGASPIQSGCISQRQGEAIEACAQLGLPSTSLHFLHLIDGALTALLHDPEQKTVHMLATCLAEIAPDSVFITSRHDGSSEHEAACQMMIQAINTQAPKTGLYEYPIWSRWRPHLLLRSLRHYDSVFSVSIAAQREIKRRAILCHG